MSKFLCPNGYQSKLSSYETQVAIGVLHDLFESKLSKSLNLKRVSAPLFVEKGSGINDDLNGVERPVLFSINDSDKTAEIVHSLAKWKRLALRNYGFGEGEGIWTDMNAIRRDEVLDNTHSVYVDQWDWEKVITKNDRNKTYLKSVVKKIVNVIVKVKESLNAMYPALNFTLEKNVTFITARELLSLYPDLSPKERENAFVKEHKTVFIIGIGGKLQNGQPHDGRAPDYDDWKLNGDLLFWNETLGEALEISSMGIRVDQDSLRRQLKLAKCEDRQNLYFHSELLGGRLPLTIGGGIGQSRLSMLLLEKAHIGEVQASIWDDYSIEKSKNTGVKFL